MVLTDRKRQMKRTKMLEFCLLIMLLPHNDTWKKCPWKTMERGDGILKKNPQQQQSTCRFLLSVVRTMRWKLYYMVFRGGWKVLKRVITVEFVYSINRPFPSSPGPLYQNEIKCPAFDVEMIFHSHANKTQFHKKGCALGFILKVRVFGTRKWPIIYCLLWGCLRSLLQEGQNNHFHL